ncbi:PREDICTED: phylloquinone omega-hydroxylase CYP4F11-like [Colobus angolensis palliatus]|uniref:phylloquinone omega-hydroxylase CYP4F11-like n=1 Tax=Colobus angolensis palliatus TaxID=336983 RepID=UPI0005F3F2B5|nr:PREDICTED: phylloquinone omega-hydroxylase CYP4F11-like [Colobus angolensis palliatus]
MSEPSLICLKHYPSLPLSTVPGTSWALPWASVSHPPSCLPCRMLQLSLSCLGLGPVAASPWLLRLLAGGSWLLARVLAWTYTFCDNCRCLQCFQQSPKQNWFWGHQGLVTPTEEGIKKFVELVATQSFKL